MLPLLVIALIKSFCSAPWFTYFFYGSFLSNLKWAYSHMIYTLAVCIAYTLTSLVKTISLCVPCENTAVLSGCSLPLTVKLYLKYHFPYRPTHILILTYVANCEKYIEHIYLTKLKNAQKLTTVYILLFPEMSPANIQDWCIQIVPLPIHGEELNPWLSNVLNTL